VKVGVKFLSWYLSLKKITGYVKYIRCTLASYTNLHFIPSKVATGVICLLFKKDSVDEVDGIGSFKEQNDKVSGEGDWLTF
jgi:hypothetical protein